MASQGIHPVGIGQQAGVQGEGLAGISSLWGGVQRLVRVVVPAPESRLLRRRADRTQGQALEALGHAVEYLVDSRMFLNEREAGSSRSNDEAIQVLMCLSRAVFAECPQVVTMGERLSRRVDRLFAGC